jgi:predicted adenine nucleotide alpha hydrolase (AANH) superfamily ATPase
MKPKLLLHSCCAPCSSAVIERLLKDYDITIYYYNPNIYPVNEYDRRKSEQIQYCKKLGVDILVGDYNPSQYLIAIKGNEELPEKSVRCYKCYELRIYETAKKARELGFDYFTTTLSISPHKNATWINEIGKNFESEDCKFLESNFKKQNGYLRSIELSKENNFYRQDYCGCEMSFNARKKGGEK